MVYLLENKIFYGGLTMTKETLIRVHRIYSIILSIVIVIAGICLMAGCINIYNMGDKPFTREIVAETFSGIAFPVLLCLGMIIISFFLALILPYNKEKTHFEKPYNTLLHRLYSKKDFNLCDEALQSQILSLQKDRKRHIIIRTVVIILASIVFLVYALNGSNFHLPDINGSMINAMWILIPCVVIAFGYALFVAIHNQKSIEKEIELFKTVPSAEIEDEEITSSSDKNIDYARCVFLAIGILCVVYGVWGDGTADVLTKAIGICTECIGLG